MSGEKDDDQARAERVRSRRSRRGRRDRQSTKQTSATSRMSQTSQTRQTSRSEQTAQTDDGRGDTDSDSGADETMSVVLANQPIKERDHETFYLREDLQKEIRRVTGQATLDFELTFDVQLEKNRHLRPLLLYLGVQQLEELSPEEVREILDVTDVLDSTDVQGITDN